MWLLFIWLTWCLLCRPIYVPAPKELSSYINWKASRNPLSVFLHEIPNSSRSQGRSIYEAEVWKYFWSKAGIVASTVFELLTLFPKSMIVHESCILTVKQLFLLFKSCKKCAFVLKLGLSFFYMIVIQKKNNFYIWQKPDDNLRCEGKAFMLSFIQLECGWINLEGEETRMMLLSCVQIFSCAFFFLSNRILVASISTLFVCQIVKVQGMEVTFETVMVFQT